MTESAQTSTGSAIAGLFAVFLSIGILFALLADSLGWKGAALIPALSIVALVLPALRK